MAMNVLFDSQDWHVEEAPIQSWGYNAKGTFALVFTRISPNGKEFPWTMNVPDFMVGNLPTILDNVPEEQRCLLRFTGGWQGRNATVQIGIDEG